MGEITLGVFAIYSILCHVIFPIMIIDKTDKPVNIKKLLIILNKLLSIIQKDFRKLILDKQILILRY
jgi:hypothetical protein